MARILFFLFYFLIRSVAASDSGALDQIRTQFSQPTLAGASLIRGRYTEIIAGVRKAGNTTPSQVGDLFHLGSNTKVMTAVLVAQLMEQKKISWTTPLSEVFPDFFKNANPAWFSLSIEQLLSHTSGITNQDLTFNGGNLWSFLNDPSLDPVIGRQEVLKEMLLSSPTSTPGTEFLYSNYNYIILGAVIDRLTKKSWESVIQKNLFNPLQMKSCGLGAPGSLNSDDPDQPWQHRYEAGLSRPLPPGFSADNPSSYNSSGRVFCSLRDWGRFIAFLMNGYNNKSTELLSPSSFEKLFSPSPVAAYTYGGLWRLSRNWSKGPVFTHSGSNTRSFSVVWFAPAEEQAYMSVTNQGDGNDNQLAFSATDAAIVLLKDVIR